MSRHAKDVALNVMYVIMQCLACAEYVLDQMQVLADFACCLMR